ncbi:MAG: AmmeMemoRadiSam system protein A [Rhodobacteraceae bacterium]|nr:AmmeMemoRadiSam system protein A [Paracoccaceae bacterium]
MHHASLSADDRALLSIAARSIAHGMAQGAPLPIEEAQLSAALSAPGACFVTLNSKGELRGCIGSILPRRPLAIDVAANAFAAAFNDMRFPAMTESELPSLEIEISVLSPLTKIADESEAELLRALRPHVDGLVLSDSSRRGVFLPQVWDHLPVPAEFVAALKRKAGFDAWDWPDDMQAERFTVREVGPQPIGAIA